MMLSESIRKAESLAQFGKELDEADLRFMAGNGLKAALHRAVSCTGWIWRQWLQNKTSVEISRKAAPFVARGLEFRERTKSYDYLALHDLFLLHCAVFASGGEQLKLVAEKVADGSGCHGTSPQDNGELHAAAWCGMMKYWILGDAEKAAEQSELIWGARREPGVLAAPKTLVRPWLKRDWPVFVKSQRKDFEKLWQRARKDGWTVKADNSTEVIVTTDRYQIEQHWCWAHCGMAMLAHREGIEVATDPFWFPESAIWDGKEKRRAELRSANQMEMF